LLALCAGSRRIIYPNGRWWQPAVTRDAWLAGGVVILLGAAGPG